MRFLITTNNEIKLNRDYENSIILNNLGSIFYNQPLIEWVSQDIQYIVLGTIIGVRDTQGFMKEINKVEIKDSIEKGPSNLRNVEGRFVVIKFSKDFGFQVWTDNFGRIDVYIQKMDNNYYISSALDLLPIYDDDSAEVDGIGMLQAMYIYGGRPAKKHTTYKQVSRLGVSEILSLNKKTGLTVSKLPLKFNADYNYDSHKALDLYSEIFIEAIRSRASKNGNVVLLSSGWDSTAILAVLVHLFGKKKTRAVIGRMKYSERSGVANIFEMSRAKQIADYFDIHLDVVDLDYRTDTESTLEKLKNTYKPQQFTNLTGFNHWILAEGVASKSNGDEVVFAGEMSDGAHNFGFSQYATIFHPFSYDFREYSDKMATYLFGPTFLDALIRNQQESDPVWSFMSSLKGPDFFEPLANDEASIKKQFLVSFFLRSGRMPLSKNSSNLITAFGKSELDRVSANVYLNEYIENLDGTNLYATYLKLYNSFHWQGSTVSTLEHACMAQGLICALPFHDTNLIEFLSYMPEDWGRGLELKPTKYPLKWMLENKIDYPMHMQTGPHSYTYDVDPNFTHLGEILNHSSFSHLVRENLLKEPYNSFLSSDYFDLKYINKLSNKFINGEEIMGSEQSDLANIALQGMLGPKA